MADADEASPLVVRRRGTACWAAPEQLIRIFTPAADIWGLGMLLFWAILGWLPHDRDTADDIKTLAVVCSIYLHLQALDCQSTAMSLKLMQILHPRVCMLDPVCAQLQARMHTIASMPGLDLLHKRCLLRFVAAGIADVSQVQELQLILSPAYQPWTVVLAFAYG